MTVQQESTQDPGAGTASANLQGGGVQPPSVDAKAIARALRDDPEFAEFIKEQSAKGVQSDKDRRLNKMERKFGDVEEVVTAFQKFKASGLSDDEALWRMKVEAAISGQAQTQTSQAVPVVRTSGGTESQTPATVEALDLFREAGLESDPRTTQFLRDNANAPDLGVKARKFAFNVLRGMTEPNPAAQMAQSGGTVTSGTRDIDTVTAELMAAQKDPRANKAKLKALGAELGGLLPKA